MSAESKENDTLPMTVVDNNLDLFVLNELDVEDDVFQQRLVTLTPQTHSAISAHNWPANDGSEWKRTRQEGKENQDPAKKRRREEDKISSAECMETE